MASKIVQNLGFSTVLANNGSEACEKIKENSVEQIDAVLMDMRMPLMDGKEATRLCRFILCSN